MKSGLLIRNASIKKQAQAKKLYGSSEIELAMAQAEAGFSPVIGRIISKLELPPHLSHDLSTIRLFAILQSFRTPRAISLQRSMIAEGTRLLLADDPDRAAHHAQVWANAPDISQQLLRLMIETIDLTVDLQLKILVAPKDSPFITSDHPAVKYNQFAEHHGFFASGYGLASKGFQMFLPLSERVTLLMFDPTTYRVGGKSPNSTRVNLSKNEVEQLNLLQIIHAGEMVYFGVNFPASSLNKLREIALARRPESMTRRVRVRDAVPDSVDVPEVLHSAGWTPVRIGLHIPGVRMYPSARDKKHRTTPLAFRNPLLTALHQQFLVEVDAGKRLPNQFKQFLDERIAMYDAHSPSTVRT